MKKHFNFKSMYRTALVALCLMTVGVGNAWGGNRRIYFDYSAVTMWPDESAEMKVHCWGGSVDGADYEMSAVEGESNLIYADINDGHTSLCFYRKDPNSNAWWNVTQDWGTIGTYNRFKIRNFKGESGTDKGKYCWAESGAAIRWTPGVAIDGLVDVHNPHNQAFSFTDNDGTYSVSLSAHTTYQFKILDGSTAYGLDNNVWTSSISDYTLNTSGYALRLCTAGSGTYTFSYNKSTHKISVTYPTVSHPNIDYCYLIDYTSTTWSNGVYIHFKDPSTSNSIAGTTWCGTQVTNKVEIGTGNYYFYYSPGDYPYFNLNEKGDGTDQTGDKSANWGKYLTWNECTASAWDWCTFTVRIQLNDRGATTNVDPTYMDVAFNSDVLTDVTPPVKTNYTFGGFYTNSDGTGTQVINADGEWIASVADYTDASKHWIHGGTSTTLYAQWTEIKHDVTVAVSPAGAGSVQISGSSISKVENIGYETHSSVMTAVPSHPAWKFKGWQETTDVHLDLEHYSRTGTTMEITATGDDQTLTAVFEPRFTLVGSKTNDDAGGMPGWTSPNADAKAFTINSTDPLDVTKECTLEASTQYKFEIHDRIDGNLGDGLDGKYELIEGNTAHCENSNKDMLFTTTGAGKYIFKITAIDGSNRAYVQLLWPHQVNFGRRTVDIDGGTHDDDTGGTLSVKAADTTITSGTWHTYNTNVAYNAANNSGYNQKWYNSSTYTDTFPAGGVWNHALISNDNCYAQFNELATPVALNNDGHGKVQISGADATNTTCGITTSRSLTAVPNTGYLFSSWTPSGADISLTNSSTNPTTLKALGGGIKEGQSVTANFTAKTYSVKLNNDHGGVSSEDGSATATYDATSLSVSDHADFTGWTLLGYWNSSAKQVTDENGDLIAKVDGYTDNDGKWTKDTSETVDLWAHWSRSITLDDNISQENNGAVTVTYNSTAGQPTITTVPTRSDYAVEGYYTNAACTVKVMEPSGKLLKSVSGYTDSDGKWTKKDDATLYTKWVYVIYRTGDSGGDTHKTVYHESYAGGTISEKIEYRMKVGSVGKWYSLSIPYDVDSVCVWDKEDGMYYKMQPYYYSEGQFKSGHYVIRTPDFKNAEIDSIAISRFGEWVDPTSKTFTPAKNTPYIIQWPHSYFQDRYVSFFGHDVTIPTSMTVRVAPTADNVVNVYANDAMISGLVEGAYVLDSDYGVGAWLRGANPTDKTTVPPFECYIRANSKVTGRLLVIRNGVNTDDNPTGLFPVINNPTPVTAKVLINGQLYIIREGKMYTVQGILVQ